MATATQSRPAQPAQTETKAPATVIPIKVGIFGGQGSGKTTTAALLSAALSKEIYGGAPIWVTDTEPGWQFAKYTIFDVEKIELVQRTVPTFKGMLRDLRDAERAGACAWNMDQLGVTWTELMDSFRKRYNGDIPINAWGDLKKMWNEYVVAFLNTKMCCVALGRVGDEREDREDEKGKTKTVKVGTKFKAGGGESFGYEPHLLIEMSLERKAKRKAGQELPGEGRMIHRADVLKDRTWALNGNVIRWTDKAGYIAGGYRQVWESFKPHWERVQKTMGIVTIDTKDSSEDLIDTGDNSEYYRNRKRREVLCDELDAAINMLWGGSGQAEKRMRILVADAVFGVKTRTAWEQLELTKVERGVRIVQHLEKRIKEGTTTMPTTESGVLAELDVCIKAFEEGHLADEDIPF